MRYCKPKMKNNRIYKNKQLFGEMRMGFAACWKRYEDISTLLEKGEFS